MSNDNKPKESLMALGGAEWLALKWVSEDRKQLAPGVEALVFSAGNGVKMVKVYRTDLKSGERVVPLCFSLDTMFRVAFFDGDADSEFNPNKKDQSLTLTLSVHDEAFCHKLLEIQDAYVIGALKTRDSWAPPDWRDMGMYSDEIVEQTVRHKFGWRAPRPRDMDEDAKKAYKRENIKPKPRVNAPHEYPGVLAMKVLNKYIKFPEDGERYATLLDGCFKHIDFIGKEPAQYVTDRSEIKFGKGFFKFGLLGVCPSQANMNNWWRVFGGVVEPGKALAGDTLTADQIEAMKRTRARELLAETPTEPDEADYAAMEANGVSAASEPPAKKVKVEQ